MLISVCAASEQRFAFALPEMDGRISLGVYDQTGKLVRNLAVNATESDFTIGLNGLIATWDGRDDAGRELGPGRYFVRGYLLNFTSEGEAFHFNDWVESEEGVGAVISRLVGSRGDALVVSGERRISPGTVATVLCSYGEQEGLKNIHEFSGQANPVGSGEKQAFFSLGGEVKVIDFTGEVKSIPETGNVDAAAVWKGDVFLARTFESGKGLGVYCMEPSPVRQAEALTPVNVHLLDANSEALIASDGREIWLRRGNDFEKILRDEEAEIVSLSAGVGRSFWVVARVAVAGLKGEYFVRQYSFGGEVLRQLTEGVESSRIYADKNQEKIFLTTSRPDGGTTIRGLRPIQGGVSLVAGEGRTVDWEVFLEKTAIPCERFGWVNGELVADAGEVPQSNETQWSLSPSSLKSRPSSLKVVAVAREGEIWLQTSQGLQLLHVGTLPGATRCVARKNDDSLAIYAGNGTVVAEYAVTGLKQITEIDAGEIDLP